MDLVQTQILIRPSAAGIRSVVVITLRSLGGHRVWSTNWSGIPLDSASIHYAGASFWGFPVVL